MNLQPKNVVILGVGPGGQVVPIPILVDSKGVVQVSPPQTIQGGVEVAANIVLANGATIDPAAHALVAAASLYGSNAGNANTELVKTNAANADGQAPTSTGNLLAVAQNFAWNGASYDRVRVANVFKNTVQTATGPTTIWTPAGGKRIRLMGFTLSISGTLAALGTLTIQLLDVAAVIDTHFATVNSATPLGDTQIGVDLGQGQLLAAANDILRIQLSNAMLTGGVAIKAWGTEE